MFCSVLSPFMDSHCRKLTKHTSAFLPIPMIPQHVPSPGRFRLTFVLLLLASVLEERLFYGVLALMTAPAPSLDDACEPFMGSLLDALYRVPDPRGDKGLRHPLGALLGLLVLSCLMGGNTVKEATILGRLERPLRERLGFTHKTSPSQSTYTRLFKQLPLSALQGALCSWLAALAQARSRGAALSASVDGKAVRGGRAHALNVFVQEYWLLLDQMEVLQGKESEMAVFRQKMEAFLARHPFLKILTFDAVFCERTTMEMLTRNNRLGIFQVKENQPETLDRLLRWFHGSLPKARPDLREVEKKRGLRRHTRGVGAQGAR